MSEVDKVRQELRDQSDPLRAEHSSHYFKTEPGDVDIFLGVTVPKQRAIARKYGPKLKSSDVVDLLHSTIHEERLTALIIWVQQFKKADKPTRKQIHDLYLANTRWINNWDLVDSSASYIIGAYIHDADQSVLNVLSRSKNIWERRIAILAAGEFIRYGEFGWTLKLAEQNINDTHHYVHKATGWMLREVGKRDEQVLRDFLDKYAGSMPRVALRYAIEKLSPAQRVHYLTKKSVLNQDK